MGDPELGREIEKRGKLEGKGEVDGVRGEMVGVALSSGCDESIRSRSLG